MDFEIWHGFRMRSEFRLHFQREFENFSLEFRVCSGFRVFRYLAGPISYAQSRIMLC